MDTSLIGILQVRMKDMMLVLAAQEVEKVLQVVTTRSNGYKAVKYEKLTSLLIQANKELIEKVEELEKKINDN